MNTLEPLTPDQKAELYDLLVDLPAKEVVEKVAQPAPEGFGIKTHATTLRRFKNRYWAELAAEREEVAKGLVTSTTTAPENSDTLALLDAGIQVAIRHHMFERVSSATVTDDQLAMVSRWSHRQEKLKLEKSSASRSPANAALRTSSASNSPNGTPSSGKKPSISVNVERTNPRAMTLSRKIIQRSTLNS